MEQLFNYFCSVKFLGILLFSGSFVFLLFATFYSWFASKRRRFWLFNLTYDDADTQSLVRSTWLAGILLLIIGALVIALNDSRNPDGIFWVVFEITYLIVCTWIFLKAFLLVAIIISSLWNWAAHGEALFKKKSSKGTA